MAIYLWLQIGLWPKRGRGWTEERLRALLGNATQLGVMSLDVFCADLWGGSEPSEPYWLSTLHEWLAGVN